MHQVLVLCVAVVVSAISPPDETTIKLDWEKFKKTYNRTYHTKAEELSRYQIFRETSMVVANHNKRYSEGLVSYLLGINHFADRTQQEIQEMTGCVLQGLPVRNHSTYVPPANANIPEAFDWRQKGAVTPVKNQNPCGSCWAFSATGAVEGSHFLKTGKLVSLSEQNLVDCETKYSHGCKSGYPSKAMEYIKDNGGIDTEDSYPYKAVQGACHFTKEHVGATVRKVVRVRPGSEADLKMAVATMGPVSVGIDADNGDFQKYKGGVFDYPSCRSNTLNHAVLIVGYGKENGKKYWIVKNSWGNQWGQKGYILMLRGKNQCGITNSAYIPLA